MRRSFLFVLALTMSCGARAEVRNAPAFDVVYLHDQTHLARWHSSTGAIDLLPTTRVPIVLACTHDGRFLAISDVAAVQFDVMDQSGVLRSHAGIAEAVRPDGARVIAIDLDFPTMTQENCVDTLDADGTTEDVSCESTSSHDYFSAVEYAADGQTVLWVKGVAYESWTIGTARDDGEDWQPLVSGQGLLDDVRWSPDHARIAIGTHVPQLAHDASRLSIVRVDTQEVETLVDDGLWIASFGFTPDGQDIVFVEADVEDGWIVSAAARMIDLGTHAIVPLAIPIEPEWTGPICVTSD